MGEESSHEKQTLSEMLKPKPNDIRRLQNIVILNLAKGILPVDSLSKILRSDVPLSKNFREKFAQLFDADGSSDFIITKLEKRGENRSKTREEKNRDERIKHIVIAMLVEAGAEKRGHLEKAKKTVFDNLKQQRKVGTIDHYAFNTGGFIGEDKNKDKAPITMSKLNTIWKSHRKQQKENGL